MWNSPYAKYLLKVEKPGRYVGGEFGSVAKEDAEVRIALAFPDAYEIGMSHIGFSILYETVNGFAHLAAERVYMPWPDMVNVMRENQLRLLSLETGRELNQFDVVGFSLQYELTFTNVVHMLDLGGIPRRAAQRSDSDALVVVGGPVAVEAEPIAPFVDIVLLGDGEEALPTLLTEIADCRNRAFSRDELIRHLDKLPFVFAPNLYQRRLDNASRRMIIIDNDANVRPAVIKDLESTPAGSGPVPTIQAVFDRYSVEIARGCTEGCRFCQAGYLYRPVRERSEQSVEKILEKATCGLGFDEVSLSALSSADHSEIEQIVAGLGKKYLEKRVSFSVPSLRAYGLSADVIEVLSKLRASGVTLAPEAGSQRLRDFINKNVSESDVLSAAGRFYERGFSRIKLYFMLGLPTETDADLEAIIDLALKVRNLGRQKAGRRAEVVVSVSTFVPKPLTPFELEEMLDDDEILRRQSLLRDMARRERIKLKTHNVGMSVLEGVFARGDVRLAELIEEAVDNGAMFDGWDEMFLADVWSKLLQKIDKRAMLQRIPDQAIVPWAHVDTGVNQAFRRQERDRAYASQTTPPCGVFESSDGLCDFVCHHCGIKCKKSELRAKPFKPADDPIASAPRAEEKSKKAFPKPAKVIQAGDSSERFRLEVAFYGRQVYVGHLDRMRHLMRGLTRAGLQLWYTQGFHPKPKMEAPPPLPLGTAALAEPFDVRLVNPPDEGEMLSRLQHMLPLDMVVRKVRALKDGEPKLSAAYTAVKYLSFVNATADSVNAALSKLITLKSLEVERVRKGDSRMVEIRQYVLDAKVVTDVPADLPIPDVSGRTAVSMTLQLQGSGGTRPAELLQAVMPNLDDDIWVIRTEWIEALDESV
ncbi:MAG: TIGR03960 family B12-binding radical SAM protein [Deltaproteobacteria bacterium]|nr:TIGR03960 family B12-binding radical SAM protein [Deltaproteobacteria bacterium]